MNYDSRIWKKKLEPVKIVLPISCVRDNGFDQKTFLEVSGRRWNEFLALKSLANVFSVLEFFDKSASFIMLFWRSWEVVNIRVSMYICTGMIRVRNWIKKSMNWWREYLIFHAIIFQSFSCKFASNHVQLPRFFPNLIMHEILSVSHA